MPHASRFVGVVEEGSACSFSSSSGFGPRSVLEQTRSPRKENKDSATGTGSAACKPCWRIVLADKSEREGLTFED
jgi:hypothetical protein